MPPRIAVVAEVAGKEGAQVRIVILDQEERARAELRAVSPSLEAIATGPSIASPGDILRAAGNANGIRPYARSVTPEGQECAKWSGGLTIGRAQSLLAACARLITSPRRSRS